MRLKLWEKNYLLTFTVFFLLLNLSLVTLCLFSFQQQYTEFASDCKQEAGKIILLEEPIRGGLLADKELKDIVEAYGENQTYMRISLGEQMLADTLPDENEDAFYCLDLRYEDFRLEYRKAKDGVYQEFMGLAGGILLIDTALAFVVGVLIYFGMKKIYKPVSNIAHELRTPLTSILGYAQLLSLDLVSEEDKVTAAGHIEREARYMRNVVEDLLTLDSLSGYRVKMVRHDFGPIVEEFQARYPNASFSVSLDAIMGEGTLLRILLTNLMENAVREDPAPKFVADKYKIQIANRTKSLTSDDIKMLNQRKRLEDGKIKGHGIGMELCAEIVDAHGWRLEYTLDKEKLRTIVYLV